MIGMIIMIRMIIMIGISHLKVKPNPTHTAFNNVSVNNCHHLFTL